MAVILPDPNKMGPGPERSGRPTGRYDPSAITKGEEDAGRAVISSGETMARALGSEADVGRAIAHGGALMARAQGDAGAAIGKGISAVGEGIEAVGKGTLNLDHAYNQLDFMRARADYFTNKTNLDATYDKDTDWATMPTRYEKDLGKIRDAATEGIGSGPMRERFMLDTQNNMAEGVRRAEKQAFKLETSDKLSQADEQLKGLRQSALIAKPEDRGMIVDSADGLISGLVGAKYLTPQQGQKLRSSWTEDYAVAAVQSMPSDAQVNLLRTAPTDREAMLDRIGKVENATGNPAARAKTSSAMGDFQFINSTWLSTIATHRPDLMQDKSEAQVLALRADPKLSREMAGYLLDDNAKTLRENGVVPTAANLYLAHFLGAETAASVLKAAPGTPVADVVDTKSISANRSVLAGKTTDTVIDWASQKMGGASRGTGSLVDFIPEDKRVNLLNRATAQVLQSERQADSEKALEDYSVRQSVKNDLASTLATGQGDMSLDAERVRKVIGSKGVLEWQNAREDAHATWANTQDLSSMTEPQIAERLKVLEPTAGAPDYQRKQTILENVQTKVDEVRKARQVDPAGSVKDDPEVTKAAEIAAKSPDDPNAFRLLTATRMAAQEKIGIPEDMRSPITRDEAIALTVPLRRMLPGQEREVLTDLGEEFKKRFGDEADTAFAYALRVHKVEGEVAKQAARVVKKLGLGEVPDRGDTRAVDTAAEISAASKAVTGVSTVPTIDPMTGVPMSAPSGAYAPEKGSPTPPARAIEMLRADPSLGPAFDRKYGGGSSKRILDKYPLH
jgi:hypothetical protein